RIEKNLEDLQAKSWFEVKDYLPDDDDIHDVESFFKSLTTDGQMIKLMEKKDRTTPVPSYVDCSLICCSSFTNTILLSNDHDITCFKDKLQENNLCREIIDLSSVNISNY
ncbi:MAG TPA: hypothetical protein VGC02_04745, partial [Methanobacterium sp.]